MRKIFLDTETTGLDPKQGHRIIEIAAIEVINKAKTGRFFHTYLNPERQVSPGAFKVHGLSDKFLSDKPKFEHVAEEFVEFIGTEGHLVIHNASFDLNFLNSELRTVGRGPISQDRAIDTLLIARKKYPGAPASLDALCRKFNISLAQREENGHGALLDSELLYKVYLCLVDGVQSELVLEQNAAAAKSLLQAKIALEAAANAIPPRSFVHDEDFKEHKEFIKSIPNSLWDKVD